MDVAAAGAPGPGTGAFRAAAARPARRGGALKAWAEADCLLVEPLRAPAACAGGEEDLSGDGVPG
ncbi:hypothetical protein [Cyanobium sp. Morenito 9A2]|uniref:hypothetical protein n=1 Tax=Cyanobium sp. Morenito 9A2 TaxID=2823718 RepID=UPI0020CE4253|nr:hypothetical protein [Cyanobium sp. Morenito 9A2]MCP9850393.1 hypothetical protein [Cyanobium sp. Morenito 9A2]